jgi:hypothetical protein
MEMREVLGVQLVAPKQVSRTKICRYPLLLVEPDCGAALPGAALLCITATNATNLPEALTEGRMLSVPESAPLASVETSTVAGVQPEGAPVQVSRK